MRWTISGPCPRNRTTWGPYPLWSFSNIFLLAKSPSLRLEINVSTSCIYPNWRQATAKMRLSQSVIPVLRHYVDKHYHLSDSINPPTLVPNANPSSYYRFYIGFPALMVTPVAHKLKLARWWHFLHTSRKCTCDIGRGSPSPNCDKDKIIAGKTSVLKCIEAASEPVRCGHGYYFLVDEVI